MTLATTNSFAALLRNSGLVQADLNSTTNSFAGVYENWWDCQPQLTGPKTFLFGRANP